MPRWSPDSNYILFVSEQDGNSEIYIIDESGEMLRVTNNEANDTAPAWGPMQ